MTKVKQFIFLILGVILLFLISSNDFQQGRINSLNSTLELNSKEVSPRELFLDCYYTIKHNYYLNNLNNQNFSRWKKRYVNKIKTQEDANVAINSMLASLDDTYSKFMPEKEFRLQTQALDSKLYGIGINIASISGKIYIINVLEGTPAQAAGLLAGDIILKANGLDLRGQSIYQVTQAIRGELSKTLELEILRGTQKFTKNIKREEIKIKTIDYKKLNNDIGYIRISSFVGADCAKEFIIALNRLKDSKGLILDLRGNSGGLFQNAIVISNLFMKKGTIVSVIARENKKNVYSAKNEGCIYDNPMVVLIDGDSASASEILSSALQDNQRAALIGTRTYGKGLVQKVYSLPNKSGMNLTIARYLTPRGKDINKKGVEPDYTVTISRNDFINNFDPQLAAAEKYLEKEFKK